MNKLKQYCTRILLGAGSIVLILHTTACLNLGERLGKALGAAVAGQEDPKLVAAALPSYLLALDAAIVDDPEDDSTLYAGAKLYSGFAGQFAETPERAVLAADRAWDYAQRALKISHPALHKTYQNDLEIYQAELLKLDQDDVPNLHTFTTAWATWIQAHNAGGETDWSAAADLPKITTGMQRVVDLDEKYDDGSAHLYLGVLGTLLPPSVGGKPEIARVHFEQAIKLSAGENLMAKVFFAEKYARLLFDRELHDELLNQVMESKLKSPKFALGNVLAKQKAAELLKSAEAYF